MTSLPGWPATLEFTPAASQKKPEHVSARSWAALTAWSNPDIRRRRSRAIKRAKSKPRG